MGKGSLRQNRFSKKKFKYCTYEHQQHTYHFTCGVSTTVALVRMRKDGHSFYVNVGLVDNCAVFQGRVKNLLWSFASFF